MLRAHHLRYSVTSVRTQDVKQRRCASVIVRIVTVEKQLCNIVHDIVIDIYDYSLIVIVARAFKRQLARQCSRVVLIIVLLFR